MPTHIYKVLFTRPPMAHEMTSKTKMFYTIGTDEADAVERVWKAYEGSSFQKEFSKKDVRVEFQLGDIVRIGG